MRAKKVERERFESRCPLQGREGARPFAMHSSKDSSVLRRVLPNWSEERDGGWSRAACARIAGVWDQRCAGRRLAFSEAKAQRGRWAKTSSPSELCPFPLDLSSKKKSAPPPTLQEKTPDP